MAFARWDPLRDLLAIQQHLDRFAHAPAGWAPPVDLYETDTQYVLIAEIPGLKREDVRIHVQHDSVTLSGARREREIACEQYHRVERGHGQFSRTFQLPHPVSADRITADLADGVLTVTIPKTADPSPRRIPVS